MTAFDPVSALFGGGLIGLASALLMLLNGRIAGVSGILGGALAMSAANKIWRLAFIAGLIAAPIFIGLFGHSLPQPQMPASWLLFFFSGPLSGLAPPFVGGSPPGPGGSGTPPLLPRLLPPPPFFPPSPYPPLPLFPSPLLSQT